MSQTIPLAKMSDINAETRIEHLTAETVRLNDIARDNFEKACTHFEARYAAEGLVAVLSDALKTIRGQYSMFVGPDDAIEEAVLHQVDEALAKANAFAR